MYFQTLQVKYDITIYLQSQIFYLSAFQDKMINSMIDEDDDECDFEEDEVEKIFLYARE